MPRLSLIVLSLCFSCGRITPGAVFRPAKTVSYSGGTKSSPGSSEKSKPVFDDKGCSNATGESGSKMQAACRSGK